MLVEFKEQTKLWNLEADLVGTVKYATQKRAKYSASKFCGF